MCRELDRFSVDYCDQTNLLAQGHSRFFYSCRSNHTDNKTKVNNIRLLPKFVPRVSARSVASSPVCVAVISCRCGGHVSLAIDEDVGDLGPDGRFQ